MLTILPKDDDAIVVTLDLGAAGAAGDEGGGGTSLLPSPAEDRATVAGSSLACLGDPVLPADVFRTQPVLVGPSVRLEPLTEVVLNEYLRGLADPEVQRLTGSQSTYTPPEVERWLATRREQHDRADWAVTRREDDTFLGEAVLHEFDAANESASYRVWLAGPHLFGRGYGTEVTQLVVDHALDQVGVHRLALEVFDLNPRARRVYEKCGFVVEGRLRDALMWEGRRYDALVMAVLRTDERPGRRHGPRP